MSNSTRNGATYRRETEQSVAQAVRYVTSDSTIAACYGVPIAQVRRARHRYAEQESRKKPRVPAYHGAGVHESTYSINDGAIREAASRQCLAHLKALLRYGLKYGLPNHDKQLVLEKAAEHGVSA